MRRLFLIGILVGFAGALAAAHFVPWVTHERLPSQSSVVANGGRAERFVIRLPADRIHAVGASAIGLRGGESAALARMRETDAALMPLLEHFKVRDAAGNVIGIAARHWTMTPAGASTSWALSIPSRGSMALSATGESARALDEALADGGYRAGAKWVGEVRVEMTKDGAQTTSSIGSREFADLDVRYTETWHVTGIGENGEIQGTIELDTVSRGRG